MRLFLAVPLSSKIRQILRNLVQPLYAAMEGVHHAPVGPDQWHITLKFLGEVSQDKVPLLESLCAAAVARVRPLEVTLGDKGLFPTHGPPRVLWVGAQDADGALSKLSGAIETACESAGFPREERAFHAHVTVARIKAPLRRDDMIRRLQAAPLPALPAFAVRSVSLIRSHLAAHGSRYEEIERFPLAGH